MKVKSESSFFFIYVLLSLALPLLTKRTTTPGTTFTEHKNRPTIKCWWRRHTAVMFFLHDSGEDGKMMRQHIQTMKLDCSFRHIKIIFPSALFFPYKRYIDGICNCWFDVTENFPNCSFDEGTLQQSARYLKRIMQKEVDEFNISWNRILIGGYSTGGAMAMNMAYRFTPQVGGAFAIASFLPNDSLVYKQLEENPPEKLAPLLYCHGDVDHYIPFDYGKYTFDKLQRLGVPGEFRCEPRTRHEIRHFTLDALWDWALNLIPEPDEPFKLFDR